MRNAEASPGTGRRVCTLLATAILVASGCEASQTSGGDKADAAQAESDADGADRDAGSQPDAPPIIAGTTYYQQVAPILRRSCVGCHRAGGIAPFALETYEQAEKWAEAITYVVDSGQMPPWGAQTTAECTPRLSWKDDLRPSAQDKVLLRSWAALGAPAGDPSMAAPLPQAKSLELVNANKRVTIPAKVEIQGNSDQFLCFSLDPDNEADVWLNGTQVNPGNGAIVHHVLVYADPDAQSAAKAASKGYYECFGGTGIQGPADLIAAWAPGALPAETPPNVGIRLKAGGRIIVNVHYHPTGRGVEVDEATSVDLRWTTTAPTFAGRLALVGNFSRANMASAGGKGFGLLPGENDPGGVPAFVIPPGAAAHVEKMRFLIPGGPLARAAGVEIKLWGVGAHMHYLGRDMLINLVRVDPGQPPARECLVQVPAWDFNWQRGYTYDGTLDQVPTARAGDELELRCTFDNTLKNPFLRDVLDEQGLSAPVEVRLGEETLDEMCLGVFGIAVPQAYADMI